VLENLRLALVELHRKLLDAERRDYERLHGRLSDAAFVAVTVSNRDFSWLGALTTLIVNLEEAARARAGLASEYLYEIRRLLTPGANGGEFNRKYKLVLQRSADVHQVHRRVMRVIETIEAEPR
jgi:hypothetical protein